MISRFCSHPFNTSYCVDRNLTFINQKFSFWPCENHVAMSRLNSGDFSIFFLCLDILFLTYSYERADRKVRKNAKFFSNILEYSWFFRLFRGFLFKTFEHSEPQTCATYHKILHKIPHRTVQMGSLWRIVGKWYHVFNLFYGGWNCVG